MRSVLLTYITPMFDDHIATQLAEATNENPHQVQNILGTLIPAALSGMINSAGKNREGIKKLMDMSLAADNDQPWSGPNFSLQGPLFNNHNHYFDELLDHLGGLGKITQSLTAASGVRSNSLAHIWKWIGPMILAAMGRLIREEKLNETTFSELIHKENEPVKEAVAPAVEKVTHTDPLVPEKKKTRIWIPIILLLIIALVVYLGMRGCENNGEVSPTHNPAISHDSVNSSGN